MTENTKPPPVLLGQVPGAVRQVVALVLVAVWLVGVVWLTSRGLTIEVPQTAPIVASYWTTDGEGDDTTILFESERTGLWVIAWEAPCPVEMRLHRFDGVEVVASYTLGRARKAAFPYALRGGSHFFDAKAECDWVVSVRPL